MLKILCKSLLISTTVFELCLWFQQVRWRAETPLSGQYLLAEMPDSSTTIAPYMPADISEEMPADGVY